MLRLFTLSETEEEEMTHGRADFLDRTFGAVSTADERDFHPFDDVLQEVCRETSVRDVEESALLPFFE